jgi:hypothetical protein
LSESEPILFRSRDAGRGTNSASSHVSGRETQLVTTFNRNELNAILAMYGRKVAAGEWRDYSLDLSADKAVFSVFRRSSEYPLYRVEKCPRLARRQGAYSVVAASGQIVKRGHDLTRVLSVLETSVRLVEM